MIRTMPIMLTALGLMLLIIGILLRIYPVKSPVFYVKRKVSLSTIANIKVFQFITDIITDKGKNGVYRLCSKLLKRAEIDLSVHMLLFYKLLTIAAAAVILIMVRYTNLDIIKISIISKAANEINIFGTSEPVDYEYNYTLYKSVIGRIGEKKLEKLDENNKLDAIKAVLSERKLKGKGVIHERAETILRTFNTVNNLNLINYKTVVLIIISFFLPDIILLLRSALLNSKYKKEVVKLENIFELLGSIRGFKTIYILREMSKASKTCSPQLKYCVSAFQNDRENALEELRKSIPSRRFSRLIDIIRVYSLVDKELAMEILERNRLEKEEEMLLTAEEDIDIVDVIAFISITPVIFELGNLLMKPMLDIISQAFNVI